MSRFRAKRVAARHIASPLSNLVHALKGPKDAKEKLHDLLWCCWHDLPMGTILAEALDAAKDDKTRARLRELADEGHEGEGFTDEVLAAIGAVADADDLIPDLMGGGEPESIPSWAYFDVHRVYTSPDWLVHLTNHPDEIAQNGFQHGIDDPGRLGLTTYFGQNHYQRTSTGYAFAFPLYRADRHRGSNYGKYAVMFKAPYVEAWHSGDEEMQAVFYAPDAKGIHVVGNARDCCMVEVNGEEVEFDSFVEVAKALDGLG
jgi:hypothetical protein